MSTPVERVAKYIDAKDKSPLRGMVSVAGPHSVPLNDMDLKELVTTAEQHHRLIGQVTQLMQSMDKQKSMTREEVKERLNRMVRNF